MNNLPQIKTYSFISLDGFVSTTDGDIDWMLEFPRPSKGDYGYRRFCDSVSCCMLNSVYHSTLLPYDIRLLPDKPCHILRAEPQDEEALLSEMKELQRQAAGDLWLAGDSRTISLLLEHGLIDEMTIGTVPVTLGGGMPLFGCNGMPPQDFSLKNCQQYDNGVVMLEYCVNRLTI